MIVTGEKKNPTLSFLRYRVDASVLPSVFDIWEFTDVNSQISKTEGRTPASSTELSQLVRSHSQALSEFFQLAIVC